MFLIESVGLLGSRRGLVEVHLHVDHVREYIRQFLNVGAAHRRRRSANARLEAILRFSPHSDQVLHVLRVNSCQEEGG